METYLDDILLKIETEKRKTVQLLDGMIQLNFPNIQSDILRRWSFGKSVDGGIIGTYFSDEYRQYKIELNPLAGGNVDLTLTGSLGEKLNIKKIGKNYQIFSEDEKYEKIGKKYGFEEFGLTEEERYLFFEELISFTLETQLKSIYNG